ncbi:uncharacterized protein LOC134825144 isoform X1 [Bolinopsis microptera]|uniref:uncharacterized protein LOC134825144 isoform X1 n=1 Tax=Bolinopsis microptera TaxID=2820187 RepID=UPI00307A906C
MIIQLMLMTVVATTCSTALVSPFDKGVMGKVSKQFLQDFTDEVADRISTQLKGKSFSGSDSGSGHSFKYWGVRVTTLTLNPSITLRGTGQLVVDASMRGTIRASGSWSYNKRSWWYSVTFGGGVQVSSNGFSISDRVNLGVKSNGKVGFSHDSGSCRASMGSLDINISGSWYAWLLNFIVWIFEKDLKRDLERSIREKVNEVVGEAAANFDNAMFNQDFSMPLQSGGELKVDFNPSVITGGPSCAVISTPAVIELTGVPNTTQIVTPPFIHIPATEEPARKKRQARDWCGVVPGPNSGVSIILTKDLISRGIQNLHHFDLLKFSLVETGTEGSRTTFDVLRNGQRIDTVSVEFPENEGRILAGFNRKTVKISSTEPPEVSITDDGISVLVHLRARLTLSSDNPKLEIRTEFESLTNWIGTMRMVKKDGGYSLVPNVTANVDIWTGKLYIGAEMDGMTMSEQRRLEEDNLILEGIESLLNSVLEGKLARVLEDDLQSGIPLNIPEEYMTVGRADISYREDYIIVYADDITINLQ